MRCGESRQAGARRESAQSTYLVWVDIVGRRGSSSPHAFEAQAARPNEQPESALPVQHLQGATSGEARTKSTPWGPGWKARNWSAADERILPAPLAPGSPLAFSHAKVGFRTGLSWPGVETNVCSRRGALLPMIKHGSTPPNPTPLALLSPLALSTV